MLAPVVDAKARHVIPEAVFFGQQSGIDAPDTIVIHGFSHFLRTSLTTADFADAKSAKAAVGDFGFEA